MIGGPTLTSEPKVYENHQYQAKGVKLSNIDSWGAKFI